MSKQIRLNAFAMNTVIPQTAPAPSRVAKPSASSRWVCFELATQRYAVLIDKVFEVLPGADAGHLRVVVVTRSHVDRTMEALRRCAGLLRGEVAHAIARKRVPQLTFEVHAEEEP